MKRQAFWLALLVIAIAASVYEVAFVPREVVEAKADVVVSGDGSSRKPEAKLDPEVVSANTEFGFRLFKELVKGNPDANVVISPASLSLALSMTYNGASGATRDAMAKTLGYSGMGLDKVNAGNEALLANLRTPGEGITISVANSLWARNGVQFRPDFLQRDKDFYGARIAALDFANPNAANTINGWVSKKTHGKIGGIVDKIEPNSILFLVNALYFKGLWSASFEKSSTRPAPFYLAGGSTKTVQMMHHAEQYEYIQTQDFQLINLGYGRGRISMYVFLPSKKSDLASFYSELTPENWNKWIKQIRDNIVQVDLSLPRFKMEQDIDADKILSALGMGVAFDQDRADFHAMCDIPPAPNVYIHSVKHKAVVDVNEKGTEAAAATSVEMAAASAPMPGGVTMVVDRPFFFAIRDNMTGEILFMGSVVEP